MVRMLQVQRGKALLAGCAARVAEGTGREVGREIAPVHRAVELDRGFDRHRPSIARRPQAVLAELGRSAMNISSRHPGERDRLLVVELVLSSTSAKPQPLAPKWR